MDRYELEQKIVDLINASGVDLEDVICTLRLLADDYEDKLPQEQG